MTHSPFGENERDDADDHQGPVGERRLLDIIHATPLALCITDEHGIFEYVNPAYCMFYGYAPVELIGRHFSMVAVPEDRARLSELHDQFIRQGAEIRGEWTVVNREGISRAILADATRILGTDGRPRKVTFIMDVTERKRSEQLREDIERLMRHELKTPLNAVINIPRLMRDDDNLTDGQRALLDILENSGLTMLKMIDFSLNLFKLETGTYQLAAEETDLLQVALRALDDARHAVLHKRIDCRLVFNGKTPSADDRCLVWGESLLYYNLFANLIKNALEASPPEARVSIEIETGETMLSVEIHNQGCIPEAIRSRFFEKYATHGKAGGTGLGTYSAKLIVETLGGSIGFTTDEETGTTILVMLPRDNRAVDRELPAA